MSSGTTGAAGVWVGVTVEVGVPESMKKGLAVGVALGE
jgi:hypothetical protein